MNIDRRQLALPVLVIGLLGVVPAFAAAEEDVVAKNVEAFRAAQFAANAEMLAALCAAELSYSHSDARVEDKATFIANATNGKSKWLSLQHQTPTFVRVADAASVRSTKVGEVGAVPNAPTPPPPPTPGKRQNRAENWMRSSTLTPSLRAAGFFSGRCARLGGRTAFGGPPSGHPASPPPHPRGGGGSIVRRTGPAPSPRATGRDRARSCGWSAPDCD